MTAIRFSSWPSLKLYGDGRLVYYILYRLFGSQINYPSNTTYVITVTRCCDFSSSTLRQLDWPFTELMSLVV